MSISSLNPGDHLLLHQTNVSWENILRQCLSLPQLNSYGGKKKMYNNKKVIMHIFCGRTSFTRLRTKNKKNRALCKPPTVPKEKKEKKSGKGKQKAKELETISEAILTEAEQLKIITKRSRKSLTTHMPAV
ncbi:hypothetical protein Tco_0483776 [Tanacetum coccineum]